MPLDVIARLWLLDLMRQCREELKASHQRITSHAVWVCVLGKIDAEVITNDCVPVNLSVEDEKRVRDFARDLATAAERITRVGWGIRFG